MARISRPTKIKILEGEKNKNRINTREPQPPPGKTTMPHFLNRYARNEWKRITPLLDAMGLLAKTDRMSLAEYCQSVGMLVDVEIRLNELIKAAEDKGGDASNAYLLKTQAGNVIISPLLSVRNRLLEQVHTLANEFGLTPVARTRITAQPDIREIDPMELLLQGIEHQN